VSKFPDIADSVRRLTRRGERLPDNNALLDEYPEGYRFWLDCLYDGIRLPEDSIEHFQKLQSQSCAEIALSELHSLLFRAGLFVFRGSTNEGDFLEITLPNAPVVLLRCSVFDDQILVFASMRGVFDSNFPLTSSGVSGLFSILSRFNLPYEHNT
jgi:hypothetical protein